MGKGENRINDAIKDALHSPLLNNNDVFGAKKILVNISYSESSPLMMEEMNAFHDFMSKFGTEIEVIWGAALEESLNDEVKVTLLATGFNITSVPGMTQKHLDESKAEELERKINEDAQKKQRQDDNQLIEKYYGKEGLRSIDSSNYQPEPFVLTLEELNDDKIIEALEKNPVFKRTREFDPRDFRSESSVPSSSLFDN